MVIKLYISVISCSQEVKKNQQRAVMILESKSIPYVAIDITDPACEDSKDYMCETAIPKPNAKVPVTPQIFNEADYCGDFEGLDMANECDTIGDYLKLTETEKKTIKIGIMGIYGDPGSEKASEDSQISNGITTNQEEPLPDHEVPSAEVGEEQSPLTDLAEDSSVAIKEDSLKESKKTEPQVPDVTNPAPEVVKPLSDVVKPLPDVAKPLPEVAKPLPEVAKPLPDTAKPGEQRKMSREDVQKQIEELKKKKMAAEALKIQAAKIALKEKASKHGDDSSDYSSELSSSDEE